MDGNKVKGLAVIGLGYVGLTTAASFASLGTRVIGIEKDPMRRDSLLRGQVPFYEPGLDALVEDTVGSGLLSITSDLRHALAECDHVLICVGTPPLPSGEPDLSQATQAAREIGEIFANLTTTNPDSSWIVCNKSTLPVGSVHLVDSVIEEKMVESGVDMMGNKPYSVASFPEFLREGTALKDFNNPDRIVIGVDNEETANRILSLLDPLATKMRASGSEMNVIEMSVASAELVKYGSNAYLATRISFVNEMAAMCELFGADVREVARGMSADNRIGSKYFSPGIGWGGSCLGKDVSAFRLTAEARGYTSELLEATIAINRRQHLSVVQKLETAVGGLRGKQIGLLGLAFKPGTDDMRDAPSLSVIERLTQLGAHVAAYDPVVNDPAKLASLGWPDVSMAKSTDELARGADALVLLTEWPEFKEMDLQAVAKLMNGQILLDGRNCLSQDAAIEAGLLYLGIGF